MQAIVASQTVISAPKVAARDLSARRTTKALAPRCVSIFPHAARIAQCL